MPTVDDYIKRAPKEARPKLNQIRKIIKAAAPKAKESISYGMPYYSYKGRLVYFAASKNHIGIYGAPLNYTKEIKKYQISKGTIAFPLDKPLPLGVIRKLIKLRVRNNEAKK